MADTIPDTQTVFVDVSTDPEQYTVPYPQSTDIPPPEVESNVPIQVKMEDEEHENLLIARVDKQAPTTEVISRKVSSIDRIKCKECNYSAENDEQLQRHIRKMHRGLNPFQCYMCDYSTYNKPLFEEHVRIHRGIKPFKCSHCPYRSASKKNTKKHEKIHRPNNPLKCPNCPFIARHVRSLNHHRQEHMKVSDEEMKTKVKKQQSAREAAAFVCEHCGTDFAVARNLASHQKHERKCDECDAILCSKYLYKKHLFVAHSRSADDKAASFRCSVCPWRGSHRPRVLLHLVHHPQPVLDDSIDVTILRNFGILP